MSWNLNENLRKTATQYPNQDAFIYMGKGVTYLQLDQFVDQFALGLAKQGVAKGDRVALVLGNTPQFVIAYYAILRAGAAVVPINPIYTEREIAYILSNSGARAAIAIVSVYPILTSITQQLETLQLRIYSEPIESEWCFDDFLKERQETELSLPLVDEEDLAVILYTSGTTGDPKGAMLTHRNMASNAEACTMLFELTNKDRFVTVLPIFHVFCMTVCLNASIACGATMLLLPKFSPKEVLRTIREEKATLLAGVPTMYSFLLQQPEGSVEDFRSIRGCISGGAPIPVALLKKFEEKYQVRILEGYGLSEAAPVTAFNPFHGLHKPGSVGTDIPLVKNRIVDDDGCDVSPGEVGELIVQGPNVMKGYLGMPEATQMALRDGWLYTGDMAKMDEDGYIYIVDRKKDVILVGGYNVYPREVEEILYQHPDILEAAVIGVPDKEYGETVKAFVVTSKETITEEDLIAFCREKIAKYKVPRYITCLTQLPKNSTGKIMRRALRANT